MELGKGFVFVARQQHIVTDTADFYIDLVFYNYFLKCFMLIDIKANELPHAAIGQMDMYVRMYIQGNFDRKPIYFKSYFFDLLAKETYKSKQEHPQQRTLFKKKKGYSNFLVACKKRDFYWHGLKQTTILLP